MSRLIAPALCLCVAGLLGCAKSSDRTAGASATATAAPAQTSATPAASLTSFEGTWQGRTMENGSDSTVANWTLDAGSDTAKWVLTFSDGTKAPVHVTSMAGDSTVTTMGPYKSASMKRQQVVADVVSHAHGDTLSGTYTMHLVATPDSTHSGRFVATRKK